MSSYSFFSKGQQVSGTIDDDKMLKVEVYGVASQRLTADLEGLCGALQGQGVDAPYRRSSPHPYQLRKSIFL